MTILAYEIHENLATHHVALEKFKDFALARGWSVLDWQINVEWAWTGSEYDFVVGDESFLMLESSGHGAQTLHFRLRGQQDGIDPNNEYVKLGAQSAGNTGINHGSSIHPVSQSSWNPWQSHAFKPVDIPKVWMFGNDKFLMMVSQFDNFWCGGLAFGTVELYDVADDEGNFCGYPSATVIPWYQYAEWDPFTYYDRMVFYDGVAVPTTRLAQNGSTGGYGFVYYKDSTLRNLFSEARPMFKPLVSVKFVADDLWRPIGTLPVYRMHHEGLQIGEKLRYGTKEFICFPNCKLNESSRYYGLAVRVA